MATFGSKKKKNEPVGEKQGAMNRAASQARSAGWGFRAQAAKSGKSLSGADKFLKNVAGAPASAYSRQPVGPFRKSPFGRAPQGFSRFAAASPEVMGWIYAILLDGLPCYVGQMIDRKGGLAQRWREHRQDARRGRRTALCHAIRKYGEEHFEIRELARVPLMWLDEEERRFIARLNTGKPNGYNIAAGGRGGRLSDAHKALLRKPKSKSGWSEERKAEQRERMRGNTNRRGKLRPGTGAKTWAGKKRPEHSATMRSQRVVERQKQSQLAPVSSGVSGAGGRPVIGWFSDTNRRLRGKPTRSEEREIGRRRANAEAQRERAGREDENRRRRTRAGGFGSGFGLNPWVN